MQIKGKCISSEESQHQIEQIITFRSIMREVKPLLSAWLLVSSSSATTIALVTPVLFTVRIQLSSIDPGCA